MKKIAAILATALLAACSQPTAAKPASSPPPSSVTTTSAPVSTIADTTAHVNGQDVHYLHAGTTGMPVVLLHGYAESSHMWAPIIPTLAKNHVVLAPDLRGNGGSSKPATGYDKKSMAGDIHALVTSLGYKHAIIVGHDIGLMVAYAYAAQYPQETSKIALMDAFLPGVGDWKNVWLMRDMWHFHFYGTVPERLVAGRERTYFEHFWNDFAADPQHSVPEVDRQFYAAQYAQPGAMHAGFEWFKNFEQDAQDFSEMAKTKLTMPMLVLAGEKASGQFLIEQSQMVDSSVQGVIVPGSGHWLMEEAPERTMSELTAFVNR